MHRSLNVGLLQITAYFSVDVTARLAAVKQQQTDARPETIHRTSLAEHIFTHRNYHSARSKLEQCIAWI